MKKIACISTLLILAGTSQSFAQERMISGILKCSETNRPLPCASICVNGTTRGTISDLDGTFYLEVPAHAKSLCLSFIGMKTKTVLLADLTETGNNILLEADTVNLAEVIIIHDTMTNTSICFPYQPADSLIRAIDSHRLEGYLKSVNLNSTFRLQPQ